MAPYATTADVQARMTRDMSTKELAVCGNLLEDVAVLIDGYNSEASENAKKIVSCRAVIRALGNEGPAAVPIGASQGSMSGFGYSQSWTMGSGSAGEVYLSKAEKQMLGAGDRIGSYSPVQELVCEAEDWA